MENTFKLRFNLQDDYYIGRLQKGGSVLIAIFSFLSIIMNMIFIVHYLLKKWINKKQKRVSSLEKILFILSLSESIISLLWFISAVKYNKTDYTFNSEGNLCYGCKIIGLFLTFIYVFDWVLSGFALYYLKNMILNPIEFILKGSKKIMIYVFISFLIALAIMVGSYFLKVIGISPMNSCFLTFKIENSKIYYFQIIFVLLVTLFPFYNILYFLFQFCLVVNNPIYKAVPENRRIFNNHCINTLINHIITLFMSFLYIIEFFIDKDSQQNSNLTIFFFLVTLMVCFNPLLTGVIRLLRAGVFKELCRKSKNYELQSPLINNEDNENELNIEIFEATAVKKFVMNIYISVCYCLEKACLEEVNNCKIEQQLCIEANEYTISKSEINKDLSIKRLQKDALVKSREDFNISCVEYAPKIFAYLRKLDMIKEEEIIKSLMPMNNKNGIKDSEGKGGSFFLNSDDNEFSLKTITFDEAELIRGLLLCKMAEYLSSNKQSIIGRIYGVYKITMKTGLFKEDEIYFILMKNVIGSFGDNLICKYDLKGSKLNRSANITEYASNVMKDNNFNELEQVLLLGKKNADKLLKVASEDANFFCGVKVMDYSLLVAKISLNKDEIEDLFGKFHRRESEIEYCEMAGIERKSLSIAQLDENQQNGNENEKLIDKYNEENENKKKNIRYNRNKIKSLKKYFYPSLKGDILYIIAIIDFFQLYNLQKTLETQLKLFKKGVQKKDISSMPPEGYKDRFIEFVKIITNSEKYVKDMHDPENKNDFEI